MAARRSATYVAGGTELSLAVFDLGGELLQQGLLHSPDRRWLPARLQSQLQTHTDRQTDRKQVKRLILCLYIRDLRHES